MFGRMQSDGRIEGMDVTLLDPHGGDLGGFFMAHGSADQCAALQNDEEFRQRGRRREPHRREHRRRARARPARAWAREMAMYGEAVGKLG